MKESIKARITIYQRRKKPLFASKSSTNPFGLNDDLVPRNPEDPCHVDLHSRRLLRRVVAHKLVLLSYGHDYSRVSLHVGVLLTPDGDCAADGLLAVATGGGDDVFILETFHFELAHKAFEGIQVSAVLPLFSHTKDRWKLFLLELE